MNVLEKFQKIHTFIFDVDGVFTNSHVLVLESGKLLRKMNIRDGYAVKKAVQEGFRIAIITGGKSKGVVTRLKNLGVQDVYSGVQNKLEVYREFIYAYDLDEEGVLFMGDDLPDYDIMRHVGLPTCPHDTAPELLPVVKYVSPKKGGEGCVRDVIEKVLKLQGKWADLKDDYRSMKGEVTQGVPNFEDDFEDDFEDYDDD